MAGGPCEFGLAPYPSLDVATARTLAPADSHISTFLMFRQLGEDVDEIGRRVDREADLLAGDRMPETQRSRVQHRPRALRDDFSRRVRRHRPVSSQKLRRRRSPL